MNKGFFCFAACLMTTGAWAQGPIIKLWVTEVYEVNPDGSYTPKCGKDCPTQDLPALVAQPGDLINIEATVERWDTDGDSGKCNPAGEVCSVSAQNCTKSHCTGVITSGVCTFDTNCFFPDTCDPDVCKKSPRMGGFQWTIDSSTYSNGGTSPGLVPAELACTTDADCACGYREIPGDFNDCADFATFGFCTCLASVCDGGVCDFDGIAYIDSSSLTNYVFFSEAESSAMSFSTLNFAWASVLTANSVSEEKFRCSAGTHAPCDFDAECPQGTCELDASSPYYMGTLLLEATSDACGTFTVDFDHDPNNTGIKDDLGTPFGNLIIEALTLDFGDVESCDDGDPCTDFDKSCSGGECAGTPIVCPDGQTCVDGNCESECGFNTRSLTGAYWADADPPVADPAARPGNCAIDAREPHSINDAGATNGWDRLVLQFDCDPTALASSLLPSDFTRLTDPFSLPPFIVDFPADSVENTITLQLSRQISPNFYTCITHTESGNSWCAGYLPADASQDGLSASNDINALIDSINLVPGRILPIHASDINRSNQITGADILRLIDLLNGASDFDPWITKSLPDDCPSAP